ncbi:MAG TPA: serpin family protein, partial [Saprospiraceae bacterium]|nr:serpin family protein [Saprospiraceae bacterium]
DVCSLTKDQNVFGFDLFQELHAAEPTDNIFISPMSISTALAMALNGAASQTYTDMQGAMRVSDWEQNRLNAAYRSLLEVVPNLDPKVQLQIANSIWYRDTYVVRQEFLDVNRTFFNSQVSALDFNSPAAKATINKWVNDQTKGLIKDIVNDISPETVMFIINAIYFKGTWRHQFDTKKTNQQPFFLADGTQKNVDMMLLPKVSLPVFSDDRLTAIDLPYGDSIFSMTILLPNEGYSMDALVASLSATNWRVWLDNLSDSPRMTFRMPKFKMEYEQLLNRALTDMGMGIAFAPQQANFTNIAKDEDLHISAVRHKAFVEIDEKGTEAAAVTSIEFETTSLPPEIIVNRPFVFVIRDNKTNSVLFIGKMMQP